MAAAEYTLRPSHFLQGHGSLPSSSTLSKGRHLSGVLPGSTPAATLIATAAPPESRWLGLISCAVASSLWRGIPFCGRV
ncbi:hypothetical protein TgHK011_003580 [Trichoderma gracile]|nr:hypothetical protein TgHK011_003580 [Trichoderma gracile]